MSDIDDKTPRAIAPETLSHLRLKKPKTAAGGVPAVLAAMKLATTRMGFLRTAKTLTRVNQKNGFDCPGCAWPEPRGHRALAEFCENGAKAVAEEATTLRIGPEFFAKWSVTGLAKQSDYWLGQAGRLTHPLYLREGGSHYESLSWDEAFRLIGDRLRCLASPNEAIFYTSGRTSNEAAFLYQLFVRKLGTNNLPDCSNLCHESSGVALMESIGSGKGTVTLEDFDQADAIFIVGQNPGTNHPRMLTSLQRAARRGCRIVSVNPLDETGLQRFKHPQEISGVLGRGTALNTLLLRVKINGDVAVFQGIQKALLEEERARPGSVFEWEFIRKHTSGIEPLLANLEKTSWEEIFEASGIAEADLREAARITMGAKRIICCWAMGLTQHKNAVANIQEIVNFLLLRGNFGRPGAGACPVRGHSNVQGDRTMGIWERPGALFLDALERVFEFSPPRAPGYDVVDSIRAMRAGKAKVFFALGGNFLSASPDTELTAHALRQCDLTVHVSTKLNRSHLVTGREALILPCLGRTEQDRGQFVTVENSMGIVHASRGTLAPASTSLLSEVQIVAGLARAALGEDWSAWANDYDRIRDLVERVIPGFEDFNRRVREPGGFTLPHAVRDALVFATATRRANFTVHPIPKHELAPGRYLMMTIRSHDQFNTTIYGMNDRYRGIYNERRVVMMNTDDIKAADLTAGQVVDLVGHFRGEERVAKRFLVIEYAIPRGCVATYFPETNVLVPVDSFADRSQTPTSKSVEISVRPNA